MVGTASSFFEGHAFDAILGVVFGGIVTYSVALASRVLPNRRLWQFGRPEDVVICVAASTETLTPEGYTRHATGVGQVRALALLMPSLALAYKGIQVRNIRLSTELPDDEVECDLISLGGPRNNGVTAELLSRIQLLLPLSQDGSTITWEDPHARTSYAGTIEYGKVVKDYGYVIQTTNPWCKETKAIVFGGSHTYGVVAAARFFTTEMSRLRHLGTHHFAALVEADVRNEHPSEPKLIHFAKIEA